MKEDIPFVDALSGWVKAMCQKEHDDRQRQSREVQLLGEIVWLQGQLLKKTTRKQRAEYLHQIRHKELELVFMKESP